MPLPAVKFGDSDKARVGDWVIAVGNPFGLGGTVTAGILSARRPRRSLPAAFGLRRFPADRRPNQSGQFGGALFNGDGEVIGINSAIYSPTGGSVGIGFAIPSNLAQPIVDQLRKSGTSGAAGSASASSR